MTDHFVGFLAGTLLAKVLDLGLGLDLEAGSFDGDDKEVTMVVVGRAGTRIRITVAIESADDLDR